MDPNANLAEQLRIADRLLTADSSTDSRIQDGERLAELVDALNQWITKGGFIPSAWERK